MTVHQRRALDRARYWAGKMLVAGDDCEARECLQSVREYLQQLGFTGPVTADTAHGTIAQLAHSGIVE